MDRASWLFLIINVCHQIDYINEYYTLIRKKVGAEMQTQGRTRAYNWLMSQTEPLQLTIDSGNASAMNKPIGVGILAQVLISLLLSYYIVKN